MTQTLGDCDLTDGACHQPRGRGWRDNLTTNHSPGLPTLCRHVPCAAVAVVPMTPRIFTLHSSKPSTFGGKSTDRGPRFLAQGRFFGAVILRPLTGSDSAY